MNAAFCCTPAWHRPDCAPCRLYRLLARGVARGQPRRRSRRLPGQQAPRGRVRTWPPRAMGARGRSIYWPPIPNASAVGWLGIRWGRCSSVPFDLGLALANSRPCFPWLLNRGNRLPVVHRGADQCADRLVRRPRDSQSPLGWCGWSREARMRPSELHSLLSKCRCYLRTIV
jgi:hypothetical protein